MHNIFNKDFDSEFNRILTLFKDFDDTDTVLGYFEVAMRYIMDVQEIGMDNLKKKIDKIIPERSDDLMTLGERLRKEGREEGKIENLQETIFIQLSEKLGLKEIPENINIAIKSADLEDLEKVRNNIFEINSLDEVKEYLN
jgi:hypothetical protein